MKFTIITACYNAGDKLKKTIENILQQTSSDYEILIKDGQSTDNSIEILRQEEEIAREIRAGRIQILMQPDQGVYDGMNQAIEASNGEYLIFMNCGDTFYSTNVLEQTKEIIAENKAELFYGDTACEQTGAIDYTSPKITGFTCYRNIPCHQSCFYHQSLFVEKKYDITLQIRADYDHFLWCFYKKKCSMQYLGNVISVYEGGGISEREENRTLDQEEHEKVIQRYMTPHEIHTYRTWMFLSLAPLRKALADNRKLAGVYQQIKNIFYHKAKS